MYVSQIPDEYSGIKYKTPPINRGRFYEKMILSLLYVDSVRALRGLLALESDSITFLDFIKADANQVVAVKE